MAITAVESHTFDRKVIPTRRLSRTLVDRLCCRQSFQLFPKQEPGIHLNKKGPCSYLTWINATGSSYPTSVSTPWETSLLKLPHASFLDGSSDRRILVSGKLDFKYACGFYCNSDDDAFLFAVFIIQTNTTAGVGVPPTVVWSANQNRLVGKHADLKLTADGGLVLRDSDGSIAWTTNTSGNPVVSMNLTDTGNLVLFGEGNSIVWRSFANPTDSLVHWQRLILGKKLIPSVSRTNWTEHGVISLTSKGLYTKVETNPPQVYYKYPFTMPRNNGSATGNKSIFVEYISGGLALFGNFMVISIPVSLSYPQYLKLEFDGQLRAYNWISRWKGMDLMKSPLGDCFSPLVCWEYEICSNRQCTCPSSSSQPDEGCSEVNAIPLSCDALSAQEQEFLDLPNATYFAFEPDLRFTTRNRCKEACANNCSCKAAFFRQCIDQIGDSCPGNSCHVASRLFSLINMSNLKPKVNYTSTVYVKVQLKTVSSPGTTTTTTATTDTDRSTKSGRLPKVFGLCVGALISVIVLTSLLVCIARKIGANEVEENYLDRVRGLPTRFSYGYLKAVTDNFSRKLGEGAFGSVYEGTLTDGTKGAMKRLNGFDHITKSFLAEVESIGSIHHLNLVRLVGFCAKVARLRVHVEWILGQVDISEVKRICARLETEEENIILNIARGLNYLHRDCRQKIIHMDIKPQNILLDENFNAKVGDFGLSKLIGRDQSHVVTTMRGTPGYLTPEWLSAAITEKVDIYSFGVVTLEIVSGRRVFDRSKDPEEMHLLKKKAQDGRLPDLIDRSSVDVRVNEWKAAGMVRVAVVPAGRFHKEAFHVGGYQGLGRHHGRSRGFELRLLLPAPVTWTRSERVSR